MRFLADPTLDPISIEEIRALGNNIEQVDAVDDRRAFLQRAVDEDRLVMSFDHDWYELIFDDDAPRPRGVVCFDIEAETPHDPVEIMAIVLGADELEIDGFFTLLGDESLRQKEL
jgi:hypothetical protein